MEMCENTLIEEQKKYFAVFRLSIYLESQFFKEI